MWKQRQYINLWTWLCSNKTLFTKLKNSNMWGTVCSSCVRSLVPGLLYCTFHTVPSGWNACLDSRCPAQHPLEVFLDSQDSSTSCFSVLPELSMASSVTAPCNVLSSQCATIALSPPWPLPRLWALGTETLLLACVSRRLRRRRQHTVGTLWGLVRWTWCCSNLLQCLVLFCWANS